MKKQVLALVLALLILLLSGCSRVRTSVVTAQTQDVPEETAQEAEIPPSEPEEPEEPEEEEPPPPEPEPEPESEPEIPPEPQEEAEPEEEPEEEEPAVDPDAPTQQDEDSERREFDAASSGELTPDAEAPVYVPADEPAEAQIPGEGETGDPVSVESEDGELTATQTVPADEADSLGTSEDGETADSMQTYYLTLLDSRLGVLFECKRLYVYWENEDEYRTVYKSSREHQLILGAGAYDVSAKLLEENLTVDAGWVSRKNPDVVVKVVERASLDQGASICQDLAARPEWSGMAAVQAGRILLISRELLSTQAGQIGAMVYMAKLMYPDQMEDVDPDEALRALTEEASGVAASGRYVYGV